MEVEDAISKMKPSKAAGPYSVVVDLLKAAGEDGCEDMMRRMTELCNAACV